MKTNEKQILSYGFMKRSRRRKRINKQNKPQSVHLVQGERENEKIGNKNKTIIIKEEENEIPLETKRLIQFCKEQEREKEKENQSFEAIKTFLKNNWNKMC